MAKDSNDKTTKYIERAPIVTVMGHVDHGKTSILDNIRKTNVQGNEYAGITQHIGAYQIEHNSKKITFIDTPGHAAFTQMRARGGKAADIVVLVVAADEGVMPQTKEAISHAKAANVPMIVAFNKIDLPGSDIQKAKQQLAQENVLVEDWGGDIVCVEVSAKTGENLDKLLDAISLVAEMLELKANSEDELEAIIIESRKDNKRGSVVSCIVRNGSLSVGDLVVASGCKAKIRSIMDDKGEMLKKAVPTMPVEVLGFKDLPSVGDLVVAEGSELEELSVDEERVEIIGQNTKNTISMVLKTDTQGTLEAVKASLANLVASSVGSEFSLKFLLTATGDITDSDILLAQGTKSIVVGFNVRVLSTAKDLAQNLKIPVKTYQTIYDLIDEAADLLEGTASLEEKKIKGRAKIVKTFKLQSGDVIAGCEVMAGTLKEGSSISIFAKDPAEIAEDETPLYIGAIKKLKKGKDDIKLAGKDTECGVLLRPQFDGLAKEQFIEVR